MNKQNEKLDLSRSPFLLQSLAANHTLLQPQDHTAPEGRLSTPHQGEFSTIKGGYPKQSVDPSSRSITQLSDSPSRNQTKAVHCFEKAIVFTSQLYSHCQHSQSPPTFTQPSDQTHQLQSSVQWTVPSATSHPMSESSVKLLHHQLVNPVNFTRWMDYAEGHFARGIFPVSKQVLPSVSGSRTKLLLSQQSLLQTHPLQFLLSLSISGSGPQIPQRDMRNGKSCISPKSTSQTIQNTLATGRLAMT
ncbi:hypothetical protein DFJ73DRAFT_490842 [Zopfochytrium polystomum]|nr:hypothetical protein DFJ73DRAFT_490842 [Zopfochytrium polystomum]